jgi:hypothetical protein
MRHEVATEGDVDKLSDEWSQDSGRKPVIARIEDLPDLEEVSGASIGWVVDRLFAEGALHMITSEPGAGKSTFIAAAGYAISRGVEFMGRATKQRPVLFLDAENPLPAIRERFIRLAIRTHEGFRVWGQWVGEDPPAAGGAIVLDWVKRCDPKPLIVVDSLVAFLEGAENDANEIRRYMEQYRGLTAMGATVVLLHHTGKSETSKDYRGSSDYKASIDIGYKLTNLGDGARLSMLELRPFKQRFSVEPVLRVLYKNGAFSADETEARKSVTELLSDLLKANPGITKGDFESQAAERGLGRNRARDFLENGAKARTVRVEIGLKNRHLYFWAEPPVD